MSSRARWGWGYGALIGTRKVAAYTRLLDNFTDADSTAIASHTIAPTNTAGTAWAPRAGVWDIQSNTAGPTANGAAFHMTCNPGVADCIITATIVAGNNSASTLNSEGIVARWTDVNNYWKASVANSSDLFYIVERNGGTETVRAQASLTLGVGETHTIVMTLSGQSIKATLDGANEITYTGAALNASVTVHGIQLTIGTSTVDNYQVVG